MNVIGIPIQISDGAIVLPSVEHDQVEKTADAECSPNSKVIVHFDLSYRHPFEILSTFVLGANRISVFAGRFEKLTARTAFILR